MVLLSSPEIALIGLDVDGTLVEPDPDQLPVRVVPAAKAAIAAAYAQGCRFAIVTGRSLAQIEPLFADPELPRAAFVAFISDERDIWWVHGETTRLDEEWSRPLREAESCRLDACCDLLKGSTAHLPGDAYELVNFGDYDGRCYAGLSLFSDEDVQHVISWLEREIRAQNLPLITLRNGRWVALRHQDTGKGATLTHVAGKLGIAAHNVMAVGDSGNDASMLHGHGFVAGTTDNADEEIKRLVCEQSGMIATQPRGLGVAELIGRCSIIPSRVPR